MAFVSLDLCYPTQDNTFQFHAFTCKLHFSSQLNRIPLCICTMFSLSVFQSGLLLLLFVSCFGWASNCEVEYWILWAYAKDCYSWVYGVSTFNFLRFFHTDFTSHYIWPQNFSCIVEADLWNTVGEDSSFLILFVSSLYFLKKILFFNIWTQTLSSQFSFSRGCIYLFIFSMYESVCLYMCVGTHVCWWTYLCIHSPEEDVGVLSCHSPPDSLEAVSKLQPPSCLCPGSPPPGVTGI